MTGSENVTVICERAVTLPGGGLIAAMLGGIDSATRLSRAALNRAVELLRESLKYWTATELDPLSRTPEAGVTRMFVNTPGVLRGAAAKVFRVTGPGATLSRRISCPLIQTTTPSST